MANKTCIGIDIGHDRLKLALISANRVKKTAVAVMPEKLVKDGRIVSVETMGEMIRMVMKENGMSCRNAAIVLSAESVFIRNVVMPRMTEDQLAYNLPFEFKDYITDELKDYTFDYALVSSPEDMFRDNIEGEAGGTPSMELMAVAVKTEILEEMRSILRKAGLRMVKTAPVESAYISLIRAYEKRNALQGTKREYCILDVGYHSIQMYMFKGDQHQVTRALELGLRNVDSAVAAAYNVDVHLAHTYVLANHEDCQSKPVCQDVFASIGMELTRTINFYRFSNPDSALSDIWICGGGAAIPSLMQTIEQNMNLTIHEAAELACEGTDEDQAYLTLQAMGIALSD